MISVPKLRWFQFTLRRILVATFWMAMCFGAYATISNGLIESRWGEFASRGLLYWSPFVGIGTLFGRPWTGLLVGIILIIAYFLLIVTAISAGWV